MTSLQTVTNACKSFLFQSFTNVTKSRMLVIGSYQKCMTHCQFLRVTFHNSILHMHMRYKFEGKQLQLGLVSLTHAYRSLLTMDYILKGNPCLQLVSASSCVLVNPNLLGYLTVLRFVQCATRVQMKTVLKAVMLVTLSK